MPSARALRAGRATIELGLVSKLFERQLRALQMRSSRVGKLLTSVGTLGMAGRGGIGGGFAAMRNLFIGSAAAAALAWPVKMAANIELASAQMAVFTGSTEGAREKIIEMQKFSAIAFQDVEELTTQMRLLMTRGIGVDEAFDDIRALAVLAAGSRDEFEQLTKAFADVRSATRLNGEEMRQFKNTAFNPYIEIMKRTGETMDEVKTRMEAGGVSFEEVRAALRASVREGGLFHGILDAISQTLIGQMKQAWAQLKLVVLPIGEVLAEPLKTMLAAINGVMPALSQFIQDNKQWIKVVLAGAIGLVGLAIGFVTFGLSVQLIAIALAGVGTVMSLVTGLFGLALNPILLMTEALAYLAMRFTDIGKHASSVVKAIAGYFQQLGSIFGETVDGMGDALVAGNMEAASRVLFAGLNLAWQQGTHDLESMWIDMKDLMIRTFVEAMAQIGKQFLTTTNWLMNKWDEVKTFWTTPVSAFFDTDEWLRIQSALFHRQNDRNRLTDQTIKDLESTRAEEQAARDDAYNNEKRLAEQELAHAEQRLLSAREHTAGLKRATADAIDIPGFDPKAGAAVAEITTQAQALLNPSFARQFLGGTDEARESNQWLRKIEKNTRDNRNGNNQLAVV